MKRNISRREFLKKAGIGTVTLAVGPAFLGAYASGQVTNALLARNPDIVEVAMDTPILESGTRFGSSKPEALDPSFECLPSWNGSRVRQHGTITKVGFYIGSVAGLWDIRIRIWRKMGPKYNMIGQSENLLPSVVPGRTNTITLASPIQNVAEGDQIAIRLIGRVPTGCLVARTDVNGTMYYLEDTRPAWNNFDWESQGRQWAYVVPIKVYMQAPHLVSIGDSYISGSPPHRSFIDHTAQLFSHETTITAHLRRLTGMECIYQNMGYAGQKIADIVGRLAGVLAAYKPRYALIDGGGNDIDGNLRSKEEWETPKNNFLGEWKKALDECVAAGVVPIVCLIPPNSYQSDDWHRQRDDWNVGLKGRSAGYPTALVVDLDPVLGTARAGGDQGNYWDLRAEYDSGDKIHMNASGYYAWAQAVTAVLLTPPG